MKARYFYERLIRYPEESRTTRKYYYGYSNQYVTIHRKNNKSEWYRIYEDGSVMKITKEDDDCNYEPDLCNIDDLTGNNFELFNSVQIIKSGYLILEQGNNHITDMRRIISILNHYIYSLDGSYSLVNDKRTIPCLCGSSIWSNGVTDYITYKAVNGIEVHVRTIKNLCEENVERKYYGARPIPFIKSIDNSTSINISFDNGINNDVYKDSYKKDKQEKAA